MKNLFIFLCLIIGMVSCKKEELATPTPVAKQNHVIPTDVPIEPLNIKITINDPTVKINVEVYDKWVKDSITGLFHLEGLLNTLSAKGTLTFKCEITNILLTKFDSTNAIAKTETAEIPPRKIEFIQNGKAFPKPYDISRVDWQYVWYRTMPVDQVPKVFNLMSAGPHRKLTK